MRKLLTFDEYKKQLIHDCGYIINRNLDIDLDSYNDDNEIELERFEYDYVKNTFDDYVVSIDGKFIELDFSTSVESAKFILDNVNNIKYLLVHGGRFDTIVGDIELFSKSISVSNEDYFNTVVKLNKDFTIGEIKILLCGGNKND